MAARLGTAVGQAPDGLVDSPVTGILLISFGIAIFSVQDLIIRTLGSDFPALQIMFIRGAVAMAFIGAMVHFDGGFATLRVRHPLLNVFRGLLQVTSYTAYYMALIAMPLAEATAIFFVSPLLVTLLSALFLAEQVGFRRWSAMLIGFAGVLMIQRPGAGTLDLVTALPLIAAFTYACSIIITRRIGRSQTGSSMAFTAMLVFVAVSAAGGILMGDGRFAGQGRPELEFLLRAWATPELMDLVLLATCGAIAAAGFYCLSQGYRIAPASTVAPFEFIAMPLAVFWGFFVWHERPEASTLLGILLIVGSGIYVLNREAVRKRPLTTGRGMRLRL